MKRVNVIAALALLAVADITVTPFVVAWRQLVAIEAQLDRTSAQLDELYVQTIQQLDNLQHQEKR